MLNITFTLNGIQTQAKVFEREIHRTGRYSLSFKEMIDWVYTNSTPTRVPNMRNQTLTIDFEDGSKMTIKETI